jgi:hypothetical protein
VFLASAKELYCLAALIGSFTMDSQDGGQRVTHSDGKKRHIRKWCGI